jgi:hypothetical protein
MTSGFSWNEPNLSPTDVKRQHYVPKMYLRNFKGPDCNIRVFDVANGNERRTSILNAAVETRFYNIVIDGLHMSTEGWLSGVERKADPVLNKLTSCPERITCLTEEEEVNLSRFVSALMFRTPAYLEWNQEVTNQAATEIKEIIVFD